MATSAVCAGGGSLRSLNPTTTLWTSPLNPVGVVLCVVGGLLILGAVGIWFWRSCRRRLCGFSRGKTTLEVQHPWESNMAMTAEAQAPAGEPGVAKVSSTYN